MKSDGWRTTKIGQRVGVARVELDHNPNLGLWYGIRRIPTILCFVGGEERIGIFGTATKEAIQLKPIMRRERLPDSQSVSLAK